jgi:hypothetical protein
MVALSGWLTPSANEDAAGLPGSKMQVMLGSQAKLVDLNGRDSGMTVPLSHAETEKPAALAPEFACWLMGFPAAWVSCGVLAMQSFRKLPRNSSKRSANVEKKGNK